MTVECGLKQANPIIYISVCCNLVYCILNFFFRIIPCTLLCSRLRSTSHKLDFTLTNPSLSLFGFKSIRELVKGNGHLESFRVKGESYEYLGL